MFHIVLSLCKFRLVNLVWSAHQLLIFHIPGTTTAYLFALCCLLRTWLGNYSLGVPKIRTENHVGHPIWGSIWPNKNVGYTSLWLEGSGLWLSWESSVCSSCGISGLALDLGRAVSSAQRVSQCFQGYLLFVVAETWWGYLKWLSMNSTLRAKDTIVTESSWGWCFWWKLLNINLKIKSLDGQEDDPLRGTMEKNSWPHIGAAPAWAALLTKHSLDNFHVSVNALLDQKCCISSHILLSPLPDYPHKQATWTTTKDTICRAALRKSYNLMKLKDACSLEGRLWET